MLDEFFCADKCPETVWHIAAMYDGLQYIPKHLFTEESFRLRSRGTTPGFTPLHIAAMNNTLKDIPVSILTLEN